MDTKNTNEKLVELMRRWQRIENAGVASTAKIMEESENSLVQLVAEIIQRDSTLHHRVQQAIVDSLTRETLCLTPEDLTQIWALVENHVALERKTIELARESLALLKGAGHPVQEYLIGYLLRDEEKHEAILADLELLNKAVCS